MGWIGVILSSISLARELVKYLAEKNQGAKEVNYRLKSAKQKIRHARSGDSSDSLGALFDENPQA